MGPVTSGPGCAHAAGSARGLQVGLEASPRGAPSEGRGLGLARAHSLPPGAPPLQAAPTLFPLSTFSEAAQAGATWTRWGGQRCHGPETSPEQRQPAGGGGRDAGPRGLPRREGVLESFTEWPVVPEARPSGPG